ncbi:unnamed protein product [Ambrosiozyma monospora]|uniref:Unnamed protein product n=1 Tax=Ambrosiozyma monospora TaxID=43982 RepID=A0ACB5UAX4_AMBMO|nr:unnamed protein product [Ambrosiozyma monospora]
MMLLPHNPYCPVTGEFKFFEDDHHCYLADPQDLPFIKSSPITFKGKIEKKPYWKYDNIVSETGKGWNSNDIFQHSKLIHFSDYPVPKPWKRNVWQKMEDVKSDVEKKCNSLQDKMKINDENCGGLKVWYQIYQDYKELIKEIE